MKDYLATVYSEKKRPKNNYPNLLCNYLVKNYLKMNKGKFIEFGCGTCEHLKIFKNFGFEIMGVDIDPSVKKYSKNINVLINDINSDTLKIKNDSIDVIFSKSFIEHLTNPDNFFSEAYRILKPGGKILTLVPDWESNIKIYFDDHTHKTPFTIFSLKDAYEMHGFKNINCSLFRQLPILWKFPFLNIISKMISPFISHRSSIKFLRWSKELMIIGIGEK